MRRARGFAWPINGESFQLVVTVCSLTATRLPKQSQCFCIVPRTLVSTVRATACLIRTSFPPIWHVRCHWGGGGPRVCRVGVSLRSTAEVIRACEGPCWPNYAVERVHKPLKYRFYNNKKYFETFVSNFWEDKRLPLKPKLNTNNVHFPSVWNGKLEIAPKV